MSIPNSNSNSNSISITSALVLVLGLGACSGPANQGPAAPAAPPPAYTPPPAAPPPAAAQVVGCPNIQIKAPDTVAAGRPARVSVHTSGADGTPAFTWSTSNGTITSGQGSPDIQIDTARLSGASITVKVELGRLGPECGTTSASASFYVE